MKTLLILVSLLTFANFARATSEEEGIADIFSTLVKFESTTPYIKELKGKTFKRYNVIDQLQNTCPKITTDVIKNIVSAFKCLNLRDPDLGICDVFQTRFISCITPVANALDQCLPEQLKGTPMLLANGFRSVINQVCNLTDKQTLQIFNPCILRSGKDMQSINTLTLKIDGIIRNFGKSANEMSVQNICSIGQHLENFWIEHINQSCPDQMTRDVLIVLFHAVNVPCVEYNKN